MNNKYYSIFGIFICIVIIIILLVLFYFDLPQSNKIVDVTVNNAPIYLQSEQRKVLGEGIKTNIKKTRELIHDSPGVLMNKIVKIVENSLIDGEILSSPIQECPKQESHVPPEFPQLALPEDMPWDDKIEYCKNSGGNIYEIDMYKDLLNYQPQRVLNF